jgi:hypothetical protein
MVFIRATKKVLRYLPAPTPVTAEANTTALGDWYVNRVVVDRRPLLLFISSESLLPILLPARDVRSLPDFLPDLVKRRLGRLGIASALIRAEVSALTPVHVGPTQDRSVVGILTDFCRTLPYHLATGDWGAAELVEAEDRLAGTPCFASRRFEDTVFPDRKSVELLWRCWSSARTGVHRA